MPDVLQRHCWRWQHLSLFREKGLIPHQESTILIHIVKVVQFTIDADLLRQVDQDPETKKVGRSAFLRHAIRDYLARRRSRQIRDAYRAGYGKEPVTPDEFGPLIEAQAWPED